MCGLKRNHILIGHTFFRIPKTSEKPNTLTYPCSSELRVDHSAPGGEVRHGLPQANGYLRIFRRTGNDVILPGFWMIFGIIWSICCLTSTCTLVSNRRFLHSVPQIHDLHDLHFLRGPEPGANTMSKFTWKTPWERRLRQTDFPWIFSGKKFEQLLVLLDDYLSMTCK